MRCAHGLCNSDSRYKHKEYMKNVYFIPFIKPDHNLKRCKRWINSCGRKNFSIKNINKNTYICTKHFNGGNGPTKEYPDPISVVQERNEIKSKPRVARSNKCLIKKNESTLESNESVSEQNIAVFLDLSSDNIVNEENETESTANVECQTSFAVGVKEVGTQTISTSYARKLFEDIEIRRSCITSVTFKLSYDICTAKEDQFKYFCSLSIIHFNALFTLLGPEKMNNLKYNSTTKSPLKRRFYNRLSNKDKLFLLLVRLRRGYTLQELAYFFDLPLTTVSITIYTWIQFVYLELKTFKSITFLSRQQQSNFKGPFKKMKDLRIIIDCTEVRIEMSQNFLQQSNTYSNYKHHNTVKFLVGIAKNGAIAYVSDGYEGAKSDVDLFQDCDITDFLQAGDVILADRGLTVQNILDPLKVKLLFPPFQNGRSKLSAQEEILTKKIAKCRIFVEHIIRKVKCYRIFSKTIPNTLLPLLSQMFYIACFLANFEHPYVYNDNV